MTRERPGHEPASDDRREREPREALADNPAEDGTRSDHAGTSANTGGYGVGSDRGSGGSGDATQPAGSDDQTAWLREASNGTPDEA